MAKAPFELDRRAFLTTTTGIGMAAPVTLSAPLRSRPAWRKAERMKITGIKTYRFNVSTGSSSRRKGPKRAIYSSFKTWLFLKIETNTEHSGWGEASIEWLSPVVEATLQGWEELLIDRDPLDVVAICDDITDRLPWKGGPVLGSAIAAINMALYDIAGKAWKVPVYQILGGKKRDRVRVYNGGINFESVEQARSQARAAVTSGSRGPEGQPPRSSHLAHGSASS